MAKKRTFVDRTVFFFNILAAAALLASYLAYYLNPAGVTFFAFAGLGYPVLLLINILFILYWIFQFKLKFLLSLICIAAGYLHLGRLYQWSANNRIVNTGERLKVMSYNVRMFNAYRWIPEDGIPQKISRLIKNENPDVLLLQEYYKYEDTPEFEYTYEHARFTNDGRNYGLKIYSRFPVVGSGTMPYTEEVPGEPAVNNEFIYADVKWKGKIIRFFNIHLASVGLVNSDYQRLQNPNEGSQEEITNGFIKILKRLHWAFARRGEQIAAVEKAIRDSPYPVVLTGDFNDTPQSYTYHRINLQLEDSFLAAGTGFGKSYARGPVPFRIDYILHSEQMEAYSYHTVREKLSDHYPVVTELEFR